MRVIADPESAGIFTSCLAIDWGLPKTCMVKGCAGRTSAIVCMAADETPEGIGALHITICAEHHEESTRLDKFHYDVVFPGTEQEEPLCPAPNNA